MGAFKSYDIRGVWGSDLDAGLVYRIGYRLPELLSAREVLVGHDCRRSTPEMLDALCRGITDSGADLASMGAATTPMVYFATATGGYGASVQITASHNPPEYNGLKVSRREAVPVGYDSGLAELEAMVRGEQPPPVRERGRVREVEGFRERYVDFMLRERGDLDGLRFGVDCGNGMAGLIARDVLGDGEGRLYIYEEPDGDFPNHPPNPLVEANLADLKEMVLREGLDIGVVFDGDGDRVMFVDEMGRFVRPDIITAVLAPHYLGRGSGGTVLHDVRTSRAVIEAIRGLGGEPFMWKVGHSHAKAKMRELGALYGGELAGHYYFGEFFCCDSGMLAALRVLSQAAKLKRGGGRFSELVDALSPYANSGEVNFRIEEKEAAMDRLVAYFTARAEPLALCDFDGYRLEFADWWLNVRPSNTEPYLRLVVEAASGDMLRLRLEQVTELLGADPE